MKLFFSRKSKKRDAKVNTTANVSQNPAETQPQGEGSLQENVEQKADTRNAGSAEPQKEPPAGEPQKEQSAGEPQKEQAAGEPQKEQPAGEPQNKTVRNLLIIDESGSMYSIYHPSLTGLNETLQTIRQAENDNPEQEHFVTLVSFNTGHYNEIYKNTPAKQTTDLAESSYSPNGGTPLFDAMGRAITDMDKIAGKDDVVLVTIITDGYENASREYIAPVIKNLVETMQAKGWVFTYIGANQDVTAVAESMSINNHLFFEANANGAQEMFRKDKESRKRFFRNLGHPDSSRNSKSDYFN